MPGSYLADDPSCSGGICSKVVNTSPHKHLRQTVVGLNPSCPRYFYAVQCCRCSNFAVFVSIGLVKLILCIIIIITKI
jgi:hypothetical protein